MIKRNLLILTLLLTQLWTQARMSNTPDLQKQRLSFIENKGQVRDQKGKIRNDIDFIMQSPGMTLFVGKGVLEYQFAQKQPGTNPIQQKTQSRTKVPFHVTDASKIVMARMEVTLIHANKSAFLITEEAQDSRYHYYNLTATGQNAITDVKAYQKITYKNIYPAIDWVLYSNGKSLKYDFIVHPGAKITDIQLQYRGGDVKPLADGSLKISGPLGILEEEAPYSYEKKGGKKISSQFLLHKNIISFHTEAHQGTLVIDPGVQWATYFGGTGTESASSVNLDKDGFIYISGSTNSLSQIATTGAFLDTLNTIDIGIDAYLAKFDSLGQLQWATYYGGEGMESPLSSCDALGHVYLAGATSSANGIATSGSFQATAPVNTSEYNTVGFLAQFNSKGKRNWGTYYGKKAGYNNSVTSLACDKNGLVYIGGWVDSGIGTTSGAHQTIYGGGDADAFLARFDSSGKRLWATFYGGEGNEGITSLVLDQDNNIYCSGSTYESSNEDWTIFTPSKTGIATSGTHMDTYTNDGDAGFLVKFDATGKRQWGTYLRSSFAATKVAIDAYQHLYVCGMAQSISDKLISTQGSFLPLAQNNQSNAFLLQFNPQKGTRNWGTYYGGENLTSASSLDCDQSGNVYIAGKTNCLGNFFSTIATPGSHQDSLSLGDTSLSSNPPSDAFIAQFDSTGQRKWATYYGGTSEDYASSITCGVNGDLYLYGGTMSTFGIATKGAHQTTYGGHTLYQTSGDAFLVRFLPVDLALSKVTQPERDTVCSGDIPLFVAIKNQGRIAKTDTLTVSYSYSGPSSGNLDTFFTTQLAEGTTANYGLGILSIPVPGIYRFKIYLHYTRNENNRENDTLSYELTVTNAKPIAQIEVNNIGSVFHFSNNNPVPSDSYSWDFGDGQTSTEANPTHEYAATGSYPVTLIVTGFCGSDTARKTIEGIGGSSIAKTKLEKQVVLYPNPAAQNLNIRSSLNTTLATYQIINTLGQVIRSGDLKHTRFVPVSALPSGTYLLRLASGNNIIDKKFQVTQP